MAVMRRHILILSVLFLAAGITSQQSQIVRGLLREVQQTNPYVAVVDAKLAAQIAYTTSDLKRVYVDFERLERSPHTTWNVLRHEIAHTRGAQHGDGGSVMGYHVNVDGAGDVIDDTFFL